MKRVLTACFVLSFLLVTGACGGSNTPGPLPTAQKGGKGKQPNGSTPTRDGKSKTPDVEKAPAPSGDIFSGSWRGNWNGGYMVLTFTRNSVSMVTHCDAVSKALFHTVSAIVTDTTIQLLESIDETITEDGKSCRAYFKAGTAAYRVQSNMLIIHGQPVLMRN